MKTFYTLLFLMTFLVHIFAVVFNELYVSLFACFALSVATIGLILVQRKENKLC